MKTNMKFCASLSLSIGLFGCEVGNKDIGADEAGATETDTTETDTTDTDTADTSGSDTGPAIMAGCECIEDQPEFATPSPPTCGESICPHTTVIIDEEVLVNPEASEAIDCMLTALRDRTPGLLGWEANIGPQAHEYGYVLVGDDGLAARRRWGSEDKGLTVSDSLHGELQPAATYQACLDDPDPVARYECIGLELASTDAVCDEGWIE
ncbi:hypothetical protein ACNOYE_09575 [Nannocystaceae bacterium ST9]